VSLEQAITAFQLVLDNVPVVAQPPRTNPEDLTRLGALDPAAAERIREAAARIR
jgi:hypothetical protein